MKSGNDLCYLTLHLFPSTYHLFFRKYSKIRLSWWKFNENIFMFMFRFYVQKLHHFFIWWFWSTNWDCWKETWWLKNKKSFFNFSSFLVIWVNISIKLNFFYRFLPQISIFFTPQKSFLKSIVECSNFHGRICTAGEDQETVDCN